MFGSSFVRVSVVSGVYFDGVREFAGQKGGRTIVTCVSEGVTEIFVTAVDVTDPSNTDTFDCSL